MRKRALRQLQAAAALSAFAAGGLALRQLKRHAGHGWGRRTPYGQLFDPERLTTMQGTVVRVARFLPVPGMSEGIEMLLETEGEAVAVHLGPSKFVAGDAANFAPGDVIEVTGSRTELAGEAILMATSVGKGSMRLELRDLTGAPLWKRAS